MTYDTPRPHTLKTIANETDREKRTVQRWYEKACSTTDTELGEVIDGTRYFSNAERDLMLTYMGDKPKFDEPAAPTVTVEAGNHQMVLATPQLPTTFDLGTLRKSHIQTLEDPLAVAQQAMSVVDQLIAAAHADLDNRKQRLEATRAAKEEAAAKVRDLKLEARLYELEAGLVDNNLNRETQALIKEVSTLQQLGKPADG